MSALLLIGADLVGIGLLVFVVYHPRHHRRDMIVALLGINAGVMGVTYVMATADISLGFGLGIFAVLSIIRLRSNEMDHVEIAYYFVAIAMGLLGGFPSSRWGLTLGLMAVLMLVVIIGDHPGLLRGSRHQLVVLDKIVVDETMLRDLLGSMLGGRVHRVSVRKVDFVVDSMVCDVRFSVLIPAEAASEVSIPSVAVSR